MTASVPSLRRRGGLAWRLIGATLGLLTLTLGWFGLKVLEGSQVELERQSELHGQALARASAVYCVEPLLALDYPVLDQVAHKLVEGNEGVTFAAVERADGRVVSRAMATANPDAEHAEELLESTVDVAVYRAPIQVQVQREGGGEDEYFETLGHFVLGMDLGPIHRTVAHHRGQLQTSFVFAFCTLALFLATMLRRMVGKPLEDLDRQARVLADGDLSQPLRLPGSTELGRLAGTLESLRQNVLSAQEAQADALDELSKALVAARAADRAKLRFLATMSHEMRTPLNAILGFARLLCDGSSARSVTDDLRSIRSAGEELFDLVGGVLDYAQLEAGVLALDARKFDFAALLREAVDSHREHASERELALTLDAARSEGPIVEGDPARVRQVVGELIANALKFTEQGSVSVSWTLEAKAARPELGLVVLVRDTGPGIAPELRARVFEPFRQADEGSTRAFGGAGLGLTLCRELARRMGGELTLESELGAGSTFRFAIELKEVIRPLRPQRSPTGSKSPSCDVRPLRVLVVEDNPINQRVMRSLLSRWGHDAALAPDGVRALEALDEEGPFDLVLMDCHMPRMNGYDATRAIRERERTRGEGHRPIFACTASALADEQQRCMEAGMDAFLTKPIEIGQLAELLEETFGRTSEEPA